MRQMDQLVPRRISSTAGAAVRESRQFRLDASRLLVPGILLAAMCLVGGCPAPHVVPTRAFYYWRTTYHPSGSELRLMADHEVRRLYLRVFDVTWDGSKNAAVPVARCSFDQPVPAGVDLIPVVYLKNDVFLHERDPSRLAELVWSLARTTANDGGAKFAEIQTDCDWSDRTRAAFFAYCAKLRQLAAASGVKVSATIRLHQVKYRQRTGIPPVDRGMLMFYNMGRLDESGGRSAIYNATDAGRYVDSLDGYPLPMDVALPVFSWGVHWRDGKVVDLMAKIRPERLAAEPTMKAITGRTFLATRAAFFDGYYMQDGDSVVVDVMTPVIARQAAAMLMAHLRPRGPFVVALFDLDERNLADYAPSDLDYLFSGSQ